MCSEMDLNMFSKTDSHALENGHALENRLKTSPRKWTSVFFVGASKQIDSMAVHIAEPKSSYVKATCVCL